jgi:hypothetical protein
VACPDDRKNRRADKGRFHAPPGFPPAAPTNAPKSLSRRRAETANAHR